jgi:hypothetical protein
MSEAMTFKVPACNLAFLSERIEKLNRKGAKLGCAEIKTRVLSVEWVSKHTEAGTYRERYYTIELEGAAPRLEGGWTFLGTLQHTEAGNILRAIPGKEIPESYRTAPRTCDHCKKIRARKDTYLVKTEAGEIRQVGHSCVADYLGHQSPQQIAFLATIVKEMEDLGSEGERRYGAPQVLLTTEFMEMAAEVVLRKGFVSRAAAQSYAEKSGGASLLETTAGETWFQLYPDRELMAKSPELYFDVTPAARELAVKVMEWVISTPQKPGYGMNLQIAMKLETVTRRDGGLLASAIGAYQKAMGQQATRESARKKLENSKHFGEVGKREIFELTVVGEHHFEGQYGGSRHMAPEDRILYRMLTADGNVATWWTTGAKLEVGKTYRLKATVKKHDDYKGIAQTVLTRCAVEDEKVEAVA